jgi:TonB family protein
VRIALVVALGVAQCFASLAVAEHPPAALCSAYVGRVDALDATNARYAIALFTHDGTHPVSGTLSLYHADDRYDVHFTDVTAADPRDRDATPSAIVVQFETPVAVEGALAVTSEPAGCAPSEPWRPGSPVTGRIGSVIIGVAGSAPPGPPPSNPDDTLWARFRAAASTAVALASDPVVREPHVDCARANIPATTALVVNPAQLEAARARYTSGVADVLVTLDATGAVVKTRIERSSGSIDIDRGAMNAVVASRFRTATFHCRSYGGRYIFTADVR